MSIEAPTVLHPVAEGVTERFDPIACLDERARHQALASEPAQPGRYLEIQGPDQTLLLPLGESPLHVGRGLAADLRLDDSSVSRRHAILVPRPAGARILDDRSANGTFVNGRRVQQADLQGGDVIVLGRVVLRFILV
ncbi:MAG TPA: FHA domain-containing protein [Solirubrobacteraceae bacterium]|jgi:pSer/pThr/pTyr-binding forkhead associated (FHA) protein|nr:FHA domain-containing protein [Solirubrobacteraceae bacterium]